MVIDHAHYVSGLVAQLWRTEVLAGSIVDREAASIANGTRNSTSPGSDEENPEGSSAAAFGDLGFLITA